MPYATCNGINIFHESYGKGDCLILISGLGSDHSFWQGSIAAFSKNYRVIVFDTRGIGLTDAPHEPYSIELFADDLACLMDALHTDKAHILGLSMGGCIAQAFAIKYPERVMKLILAATFAVNNRQAVLFLNGVLAVYEQGISPKNIYGLLAPWMYSLKFLNDPENEALLSYDENAPNQQEMYAWRNQYTAMRGFNSISSLQKITAPTLIIAAEKDRLAHMEDAQVLAAHIQDSTLSIIADSGHLLNYEQPELFHRYILDFLNGQT